MATKLRIMPLPRPLNKPIFSRRNYLIIILHVLRGLERKLWKIRRAFRNLRKQSSGEGSLNKSLKKHQISI